MENRKTALERAFELASSGRCLTVSDIAHKLRDEKHDLSQLEGPELKKQLMVLIKAATNLKKH